MSDDFYQKLLERLTLPDGHILTYDEVMQWPEGKLTELEQQGKVRPIDISETVQCVECHEGCLIIPDIRQHPETMKLSGVYVCHESEDIGRFSVDLNRRKRWIIYTEKLLPKRVIETKQITRGLTENLNVKVANAVIKHPNANSKEIAKMAGSTDGSVRTVSAWKMRKQLRQRYISEKGWKDSKGNMDAISNQEIQAEHFDVYEMFQKYKSEKNVEYPTVLLIAQKLNVTETQAKELLKEAQSLLNFSADRMD
jgi:hypothetical protein